MEVLLKKTAEVTEAVKVEVVRVDFQAAVDIVNTGHGKREI
jgi:hypothetical protein